MVDASKLLGVGVMTGHWEFTLGTDRVMIVDQDLDGHIDLWRTMSKTWTLAIQYLRATPKS